MNDKNSAQPSNDGKVTRSSVQVTYTQRGTPVTIKLGPLAEKDEGHLAEPSEEELAKATSLITTLPSQPIVPTDSNKFSAKLEPESKTSKK